MVATVVTQGADSSSSVIAWDATNPSFSPVVRWLGLHQAFTAPVFWAAALLLAMCTSACAWRRAKVARFRARALTAAAAADPLSPIQAPDLGIVCDPALSGQRALEIASGALERLGIRMRRRGDMLTAVSPAWSAWGSAVFHWALVALIAAVLVGQLVRSEGMMPVAVGQTLADVSASYALSNSGPWHYGGVATRSIRLDSFDPDYKTGGIDRGAVPTISVLDGAGEAVVTQRIYPNHMLHTGSLAINAPACGLSATLSFQDKAGAESGRVIRLVDFSQTATEGTSPIGLLSRRDSAGRILMKMSVTVPLDRAGQGFGEWIPKRPSARLHVTSADGGLLFDGIVRKGESVDLPEGGAVRLVDIGWFSWLSLVDDPTIPVIYAVMVVALVGLSVTTLARQQLVLVTATEGSEGVRLDVALRLWRNVPTSRGEVERELRRALGSDGKGSVS